MRTWFTIFILLISFPLTIFSSSSYCNDFVNRMIQRTQNKAMKSLSEQEKAFHYFTANKTNTDFGKREECMKIPSMKYFVAIADTRKGMERKLQQGHGVCLPVECDNSETIKDQDFLKNLFNYKKWAMTKNIQMYLYDPLKTKSPRDFAFYLAAFLFSLIIVLSVVSTYKIYKAKKNANKLTLDKDNTKETQIHWMYKSFDMKEHALSLYQTAKEQKLNENIAIFNFLRVITSFWVIYYHTQYNYSLTSSNFGGWWTGFRNSKYLYNLWVAGDLSVEYFFVMTGFLSAYTLVPKLSREKFGIGSYFTILKHRFLRFWPVLMFAFLFWWKIVPQLFSGPLWYLFEYKVGYCDKLWWSKVFLVENITNYYTYKDAGQYCMIHTWYIPTEFQIYFVAVLALAIFAKYRKIGYTVMAVLIIQSLYMGTINIINYKFIYPTNNSNGFWHYFRMTPYTRWYSLFIGVVWGLLYYEYTKLQKKNIFYVFEKVPIISYLSIILGLALNFLVLFLPMWPAGISQVKKVWYSLRVLLISIAITMIFMPLASNRSFYIKKFLNLRIFQIMGKISFMTYLFADCWIYVLAYINPSPLGGFTNLGMLMFTFKVFLVSQPVAILAHLMIEKPLLSVETYLTKPKNNTKPKMLPSQPMQDNSEETIELVVNTRKLK